MAPVLEELRQVKFHFKINIIIKKKSNFLESPKKRLLCRFIPGERNVVPATMYETRLDFCHLTLLLSLMGTQS